MPAPRFTEAWRATTPTSPCELRARPGSPDGGIGLNQPTDPEPRRLGHAPPHHGLSGRAAAPAHKRAFGLARTLGALLGGLGIILVGFVVFELFGTALIAAHSQQALRRRLDALLAHPRPPAGKPAPPPTTPAHLIEGSPIGVISIPAVGIDKVVVQGVGTADLRMGPGHYPTTPWPPEPGNVAIAGHRTTYGAPFFRLGQLQIGDEIDLTTFTGTYRYRVVRMTSVLPSDVAVIGPTPAPELTLTTCNPPYSAAQRLVVVAALFAAPGGIATSPGPGASSAQAGRVGPSRQASSPHRGRASPRSPSTSPPHGGALSSGSSGAGPGAPAAGASTERSGTGAGAQRAAPVFDVLAWPPVAGALVSGLLFVGFASAGWITARRGSRRRRGRQAAPFGPARVEARRGGPWRESAIEAMRWFVVAGCALSSLLALFGLYWFASALVPAQF
jgi:sortase A